MRCTSEFDFKFMTANPTKLGTIINQLGQTVDFYEHPTKGDEAPIYARIYATLGNTSFYDLGDMYEGSDYLPVLVAGEMMTYGEYEEYLETLKANDTELLARIKTILEGEVGDTRKLIREKLVALVTLTN